MIVKLVLNNNEKLIIVAVGLCGTENSVYAEDIIKSFQNEYNIIIVRGVEMSNFHETSKFFVKNDTSHLQKICNLFIPLYKESIGIGISLGGALMLQVVNNLDKKFNKLFI